jgi:hypothetical protein
MIAQSAGVGREAATALVSQPLPGAAPLVVIPVDEPSVSSALLRLGLATPTPLAPDDSLAEAPDLDALREVERVGAHLGGLEARLSSLGPEARAALGERLVRARLLADLAGALADLREAARDRLLAGVSG